MVIKKLHLENFKCFKSFDAEFSEGINLIIGINGAGKTSLLKGLSVAAGTFWLKMSGVKNRVIEEDEIRVELKQRLPQHQFPVVVTATGDVYGREGLNWTREQHSVSGGTTFAKAKEITALSEQAEKDVQNGAEKALPLIAYFSSSRLSNQRKSPREGAEPIGRYRGYYNGLNDTNTQRFIQMWYGDREQWVSQNKQIGIDEVDEGLELMREMIKEVFPEATDSFYYKPSLNGNQSEQPDGLYISVKSDTVLHESFLSDGERNLLWLLLEMTWRAYMLNPFLGKNAAAETNGIVMIDEIELHLHPGLQQKAVGLLHRLFPKIQFFLTTHSPIVIGSVGNEHGVYALKDKQLVKVEGGTYGKDASYLIRSAMGGRSRLPEVTEKLDEYFRLIQLGEGEQPQALALRTILDKDLGGEDAELAKADTLLSLF